jgi:hypothetical protein
MPPFMVRPFAFVIDKLNRWSDRGKIQGFRRGRAWRLDPLWDHLRGDFWIVDDSGTTPRPPVSGHYG